MPISERDVRHIAKLASLALSDQEVARMTGELDAIVAYVEQLRAVPTDGVEAIANVTGLANVTRVDQPGTMLAPKDVLALAPLADEVAILVPKAVDR